MSKQVRRTMGARSNGASDLVGVSDQRECRTRWGSVGLEGGSDYRHGLEGKAGLVGGQREAGLVGMGGQGRTMGVAGPVGVPGLVRGRTSESTDQSGECRTESESVGPVRVSTSEQ
ncbi:hypothetical protein AVEN_113053-1 [Araneus ventricosus]|uniref:Uncharacterized protein n=1 Tax=Araneus ventricosus TaxID=182803 RepID=A0A4Y2SI46_ARAVE|nr:hypothetical protein AVEN_113053-1 [Araneus ventricosus]